MDKPGRIIPQSGRLCQSRELFVQSIPTRPPAAIDNDQVSPRPAILALQEGQLILAVPEHRAPPTKSFLLGIIIILSRKSNRCGSRLTPLAPPGMPARQGLRREPPQRPPALHPQRHLPSKQGGAGGASGTAFDSPRERLKPKACSLHRLPHGAARQGRCEPDCRGHDPVREGLSHRCGRALFHDER